VPDTHYDVLGIARDASSVEVEAAFRERSTELRERTYAGVHTLEDMREAYRVLSNVVTRAGYDETLPRVRVAVKKGGVPGWIKWALPLVLLAALPVAIYWSQRPRNVVMNVGPITRVQSAAETAAAAEAADPTRPEPVIIPAPAPLETGAPLSSASVGVGGGLRGNAEEVFASASPSIARVLVMDIGGRPVSQGSGVVVGPGVIVTNCHVTKGSHDITVKVGREEYRASPLSADEDHDLCRLTVAGLSAPAVPFATATQLKTGQRVFAIGAPQGFELTISEGIVSSLRPVADGNVIQTTAPISPGSSGGGLFDTSGRLVGIVTFQHKYGQNLNFALPADWIPEAK
jgi:serine protease Do